MSTTKAEKSGTHDSITIGIFAAINLVTFLVIGGAAGTTLTGTAANISITVFFTSITYMLFISKARKRGTFLIMGTTSVLPDLVAASVIGVIVSVVGWPTAEIMVSASHYKSKKMLTSAYILDCTLHSARYTPPMYLFNAQYLIDRQEVFRLTDEALAAYLRMFTWSMFFIMVALTVVTGFLDAVFSARILKKHLEKAGLL